jgi:hypothetical protein
MSRTYNITGSMLTDLMKTVYTSDDFADMSSKNMYVAMANSFTDEVWYRSYEEAKKKAQKGIVGIEDKLMLQGEALNLKKDEIIPFVEEEIMVRYYFQEAGIKVRLRYDEQLKEALTKPLISF